MTDVVEGILDVHTANLLLQWSSAKGQSLAESGVAKHFMVKAGSKLSLFGPLTLVLPPNLEDSQLIHNNLYSISGAIIRL